MIIFYVIIISDFLLCYYLPHLLLLLDFLVDHTTADGMLPILIHANPYLSLLLHCQQNHKYTINITLHFVFLFLRRLRFWVTFSEKPRILTLVHHPGEVCYNCPLIKLPTICMCIWLIPFLLCKAPVNTLAVLNTLVNSINLM